MSDILKDATARPWNNGKQADGKYWLVEHERAGNSAAWTIGSKEKTVAIAVTTGHYENLEFTANARLIVTAVNSYEPMLAALEALRKMADGDEPDYDEDGEEIEPFALMRAAIALAKGETS